MQRKDCENMRAFGGRTFRRGRFVLCAFLLGGGWISPLSARAQQRVHVFRSAVVVGEAVRLSDVVEMSGFDPESARQLAATVVAESPPPGGSRVIPIDAVRDALRAGGANLARVTLSGSVRCTVRRPTEVSSSARQAAQVGPDGRYGQTQPVAGRKARDRMGT
ncbi:MAG: hypothetical protein D6788_11025, partial [Planctomycetota bacterium]